MLNQSWVGEDAARDSEWDALVSLPSQAAPPLDGTSQFHFRSLSGWALILACPATFVAAMFDWSLIGIFLTVFWLGGSLASAVLMAYACGDTVCLRAKEYALCFFLGALFCLPALFSV